uniref:Uncharacterized protein n=1 Tax=Medicago truncatula TaxID=3880 RepID=B7FFX8_MEDTR|nr:unknown [Medicago truncatula]
MFNYCLFFSFKGLSIIVVFESCNFRQSWYVPHYE